MGWWLSIGTSESQNPGANTSTVYADLYLNWTAGMGYANWDTSWAINIGGNVKNSGTYRGYYGNSSTAGSALLGSHAVGYTHNPDGTRGAVGTSGSFSTATSPSYLPGNLNVGGPTYVALNYTRTPSAPASMTVTNVGTTLTATWPDAATPFGPLTYYYQYRTSSNGGSTWGAWTADISNGSATSFSGTFTGGLTYQFQVKAHNSDGDSGWTVSNTLFLTAGGKRFTGSNWALTTTAAKRWTGSAWTDIQYAKRYDDVTKTWINLS